jgi:hypothetical protein
MIVTLEKVQDGFCINTKELKASHHDERPSNVYKLSKLNCFCIFHNIDIEQVKEDYVQKETNGLEEYRCFAENDFITFLKGMMFAFEKTNNSIFSIYDMSLLSKDTETVENVIHNKLKWKVEVKMKDASNPCLDKNGCLILKPIKDVCR